MSTSNQLGNKLKLLLGMIFLLGPISCTETEFAMGQNPVGSKKSDDAKAGTFDFPDKEIFPKFDLFTGSDEAQSSPVDIIFAVDTSGSMRAEKARVEQTMSAFIKHFQDNSKDIDYQLYLMGAGFSFPDSSAANIQIISQYVGSRDALSKIQKFFEGEITNPLPLRPESSKQLVVITDDNSSMSAAAFKTYVNGNALLASKTSLNGFVWIEGTSQETSTCTRAKNGSVYQELAADAELAGKISDLCAADWNKLFTDLAKEIITKEVTLSYELTNERDASLPIEVGIDGVKIDESQYSYDKNTNSVVFTAESAPSAEQKIEVKYH
jgi:hypothetical protein